VNYACPEIFGTGSNGVALGTARERVHCLGYVETFGGSRDCTGWGYGSSICRLVVKLQVVAGR